ncbi:MAG: methylenetetrahydrofolate reductase [NAD(P)H] [Dehalococcoidia bacterium]|nr:methylenetetrahydrofolate reductase [NAD(P)H] [Dehalococcoidia bacterium]
MVQPVAKMISTMRIGELLQKRGKSLSFEFFSPKEEAGLDDLSEVVNRLEGFRPSFISVTYAYGAGGATREKTARTVERLNRSSSLSVMPHLTCIDQEWSELKGLLQDYRNSGIANILALRGDPPPGTEDIDRSRQSLRYAADLVRLIAPAGNFSIGVAVYPEGHMTSPSLDSDMLYTRDKVEAGAEFAITQMFFENRMYYSFLDRAEKWGIKVPIVAGIMPIHDIEKIQSFCRRCGASLPASHIAAFGKKPLSPEESQKISVELATAQVADLMANGVRNFHFYTLNRDGMVTRIIQNLGLESYGLEDDMPQDKPA